jgi:hypothetical protein
MAAIVDDSDAANLGLVRHIILDAAADDLEDFLLVSDEFTEDFLLVVLDEFTEVLEDFLVLLDEVSEDLEDFLVLADEFANDLEGLLLLLIVVALLFFFAMKRNDDNLLRRCFWTQTRDNRRTGWRGRLR